MVGRKRGLDGIPEILQSEGWSSSEEGGNPGVHNRRVGVGGLEGEDEEGGGEGDDSEDVSRVSAGPVLRVSVVGIDGEGASKSPLRGVALCLALAFPLALDTGRVAFRWDFCRRDEGAYL
jgi:hypothetical protein